jgi:hypothetical protein
LDLQVNREVHYIYWSVSNASPWSKLIISPSHILS